MKKTKWKYPDWYGDVVTCDECGCEYMDSISGLRDIVSWWKANARTDSEECQRCGEEFGFKKVRCPCRVCGAIVHSFKCKTTKRMPIFGPNEGLVTNRDGSVMFGPCSKCTREKACSHCRESSFSRHRPEDRESAWCSILISAALLAVSLILFYRWLAD